MLHDRGAAKRIVQDALRGEDGDPMGQLTPLDKMFQSSASTAIFIPILDSSTTIRCLRILKEEIPRLIDDINKIGEERSKRLFAENKLKILSKSFRRMIRKK